MVGVLTPFLLSAQGGFPSYIAKSIEAGQANAPVQCRELPAKNITRELQGRKAFWPSKQMFRGLFSAYYKIVKIRAQRGVT